MLNNLLRRFGVQLTRTSTIERMTRAVEAVEPRPDPRVQSEIERLAAEVAALSRKLNAVPELESRLAGLESRHLDEGVNDLIRYAMKAHWHAIDRLERCFPPAAPARCPLCGHEPIAGGFETRVSECIFQGGRLQRFVCPACDAIFGPHKMFALDDELLDLEYRNLYRVYSESDSTLSSTRAFALLKPSRDGAYLDFGCGGTWTAAIQTLRDQGWNLRGFEPSARHSSVDVLSRWAEIESLRFDGIYSHNVLEHLFDPVATTIRLRGLLNPGGRIVHVTPCFEYLYEYTRFHVFFFPGRAAEVLAARAGMRIVDRVRDGEFMACVLEMD